MKLTQPVASSDVDEARAVAQRLAGAATGPAEAEPPPGPGFLVPPEEAPTPPPGAGTVPVEATPPAPPFTPSAEGPEATFESALDPMAEMSTAPSEPTLDPMAGLSPEPPAADPLAGMMGALSAATPESTGGPPEAPFGVPSDPLAGLAPEAPAGPPVAPLSALSGPSPDPFPPAPADAGDPLGALLNGAGAEPAAGPPDSPAPTWAQILEDCLRLARCQGALLMDSQGGVLESCGEWPSAGVVAVAGKLQPIVEKKHQEAPGMPVPLRLGSRVLTAWRVSIGAGMLTVALLGDSAPPPATRAEVDSQLRTGALP